MPIRSQIRSDVYTLLRESSGDSHFVDADINTFIDQASELSATIIEHPRKFYTVAASTVGTGGAFTVPTDFIMMLRAYWGNTSSNGDSRRLLPTTEEALGSLYPNWRDLTDTSKGRPKYVFMRDKNTACVFPRPDATEVVSGKLFEFNYVYAPASLTSDSSSPDLPIPYQNILRFYICHLCYLNMGNKEAAKNMLEEFMTHHKQIQSASTKEIRDGLRWQWGNAEDVGDGDGGEIVFI